MIKIFGYDSRRLVPTLLLVLGAAFVLPYFTGLLYMIFPSSVYTTLARITFYGIVCYVISKQVFVYNFSKLFGKEAYFYRTIPISNIKLIIEKFVVVWVGIIGLLIALLCLEVNSGVVLIWNSGIPLSYAYSGQLGEFNLTVAIGFSIGILFITSVIAQSFCVGQLGICGFLERFSTKTVYWVAAIVFWIINQGVYIVCVLFVPGILLIDKHGNFSDFQMRLASENGFPVVGLLLGMVIMTVVPFVIYLILGRKQVNLR